MKLNKLFFINGIFNALGGVILFFLTSILDKALHLGAEADFLWYLLGACSISIAVLSFYAYRFKEKDSIKATVITIMTFHGLSSLVSAWVLINGTTSLVWTNMGVHIVFFLLFLFLGIFQEI
jgi:hypothetical protein